MQVFFNLLLSSKLTGYVTNIKIPLYQCSRKIHQRLFFLCLLPNSTLKKASIYNTLLAKLGAPSPGIKDLSMFSHSAAMKERERERAIKTGSIISYFSSTSLRESKTDFLGGSRHRSDKIKSIGSLSPRHGASSGCGWRNGLLYGGLL
jgi:hypothetical protein